MKIGAGNHVREEHHISRWRDFDSSELDYQDNLVYLLTGGVKVSESFERYFLSRSASFPRSATTFPPQPHSLSSISFRTDMPSAIYTLAFTLSDQHVNDLLSIHLCP